MPSIPFTISGTITDTSSAAASGAVVTITNRNTHKSLSATSNSDGAYEIEGSALDLGITANDWLLIHADYNGTQSGEVTKQVSAADLIVGIWENANITLKSGSLISDGICADDFLQILTDMGRVVSYKVVTKTTDPITGSETSTFAAASNKTVIFFREENRYIWDRDGLLEVGDSYVIAPTTLGIKRYDQYTIDGNTFYINNVTRRHVLGTAVADFGVCFLVA